MLKLLLRTAVRGYQIRCKSAFTIVADVLSEWFENEIDRACPAAWP